MGSKELPFVSVVVCCYNGADVLPACLRALKAQNYQGKLEIIVVDDGSSDNTSAVAASFKDVRVIRNAVNKGLAGSRNVGIAAASGEIIAFTDDDCRPTPRWISELQAAYTGEEVWGVGGLVTSRDKSTLTLRYLQESKPLAPLENALAKSTKLTYRFGLYLKGLLGIGPKRQTNSKRAVYSLVGANMSFRKIVLEAVGGFDDRFRFGSEEEDVCKRIGALNPGSLIFAPKAKIGHHFEPDLKDTLRRASAYGKGNARMLHKHGGNPIIYPFPIALPLLSLLGLLHPFLFILPLLAVPFVYARWLRLALARRSFEPLAYSYIQCLQEWHGNVGFIKGWWQFRHMFKEVARRPYTAVFGPAGLLIGGIAASYFFKDSTWMHMPVAIGMVMVPGYLLLRVLGVERTRFMEHTALAVAAGIAWIMALGFAAVALLPHVGVDRPLAPAVMTVTFVTALAILSGVALRHKVLPVYREAKRRDPWTLWLYGAALLLPFLSFVGTSLLNNGYTNAVTIGMFLLAMLAGGIALWRHASLPAGIFPALLFSISVSALWTYSLRSAYVFGWDIQQEFEVFQATLSSGNWLVGQPHSAYDAMLSLTMLPTSFAQIAGLSGGAIFKVLYPILFSFFPVLLYYGYRLFVRRWVAFVAAALTIAQFYYMQQFSALARQQIAFLFFAAFVYLMFSPTFSPRSKRWLIGGSLFGLIVSHYSSTYVAIALLGGAWLLTKIAMSIRYRQLNSILIRREGYIKWWMVAVLIGGAVLWYGPITESSGALREAARPENYTSAVTRGLDAVEDRFKDEPATETKDEHYLEAIGAAYQNDKKEFGYYPGADNSTIREVDPPHIEHRGIAYSIGRAFDIAIRPLWWLLGFAAVAVFLLRVFGRFDQHRLEMGLLAASAAGLFIAVHLVPEIGRFYNITRMNQHMLMLISLPAVLAAIWLLRRFARPVQRAIVGGALGLTFMLGTGLMAQFGGGTPTANLNNFGSDYQRFYIHQSDTAAATWLGETYNGYSPVFVDRYATLHLTVPTTITKGLVNDVTPETIARGAYVYAGYTNVVDNTAMSFWNGKTVEYQFPEVFIKSHKNTLYSNGKAEIYR